MTIRHMVEGLMRATLSRTHVACSEKMGLPGGMLSRITNGKRTHMLLSTFDAIQQRSGIPADTLLAWYRIPEDGHLPPEVEVITALPDDRRKD